MTTDTQITLPYFNTVNIVVTRYPLSNAHFICVNTVYSITPPPIIGSSVHDLKVLICGHVLSMGILKGRVRGHAET